MAKKPAMRMYRDFRELLSILNESGVKYLVIGGYAVGYHAQPRVTKDLDLLVKSDLVNATALLLALREFHAPVEDLTAKTLIEKGKFLRFGRPPVAVDILPEIDGITFEDAWKNRVIRVVDAETGLKAMIISDDDLIKAKLAAGRPQDLADVAAIRKARLAKANKADRRQKSAPKQKR
jgi:predicted nucleotidyltransferase